MKVVDVIYFTLYIVLGGISTAVPIVGPAILGWFCSDSKLSLQQIMDRLFPFGVGLIAGFFLMPKVLDLPLLWHLISVFGGMLAFIITYVYGNLQKV